MIKINLVAEAPAAAVVQAERPKFSLGAKQGDIILMIVLASGRHRGRHPVVPPDQQAHSDLREVERERRRERDELLVYIKKVEELEARREALRHKINVINELKQNQQGPVRIMDEVSRALPELVWLTSSHPQGHGCRHQPVSRWTRTRLPTTSRISTLRRSSTSRC